MYIFTCSGNTFNYIFGLDHFLFPVTYKTFENSVCIFCHLLALLEVSGSEARTFLGGDVEGVNL